RRDAQHHRIADHIVHLVALEHCLGDRDRHLRFSRRVGARHELHAHIATQHAGDLCDPLVAAAVEHRDHVANAEPQHPRQMLAFVARQQNCIVTRIQRRRKEPMHRPEIKPQSHRGYTRARMFFRGQLIGKYKILQSIGSGGFGTVYLAEDTWIDKKVVLKVPHRQTLDFSELLREPRLLASLNHPNIVTILTAERQDNIFFIVMEFVPGETLETIIARDGALDLPRALDYTCQICNAVDHAHRQGILHRDLRPANVLVADSGMLKVADFGTSRFLEIAAHGTTVIGSPPYMAPEQFQGKAVFASDLYSIGVTMYQMMTGLLPYDTPSPADLDRLMRGELVTAPRLKNPKIPR